MCVIILYKSHIHRQVNKNINFVYLPHYPKVSKPRDQHIEVKRCLMGLYETLIHVIHYHQSSQLQQQSSHIKFHYGSSYEQMLWVFIL